MFEKVAEIIAEYKDIDVTTITPESTFEDLGVDSLDTAELVMEMEDKLGITIEMDKKVTTVDELIKMIEENM